MYELVFQFLKRLKKEVWPNNHLKFITQKSHNLFLLHTCLSCNLVIQNKWKTYDLIKQLKKQRLSHDVYKLAYDLPEFVHSIRTYGQLKLHYTHGSGWHALGNVYI